MASSSASQKPASPMDDDKDKPRLTEKEKKANHIASEQKRRQAIREGFDRLTELVPGLAGQARSEGIVLNGTVEYIRKVMLERRAMIEALEARGATVDADLKSSLEMLPAGWLEAGGYGDSPAHSDNNGDRHRAEGSGSPGGASEPDLPEGAG
ncbi:hypothetical protein BT67DRAFT_444356 [Trichocladium antarcticum]|uniref:BHLH domain-containing protein n=1 Tax=Trichocladium antarcticum TaxID=1450529 RepID=A0AAN6UFU9_9PEZI|nr:hypothetical protein BT67DRAFT_444356 [Trichocladium antarcticum]